MTITHTEMDSAKTGSSSRTWFLAALGLFLTWMIFLFVLGLLSAYGPEKRNAIPETGQARPE